MSEQEINQLADLLAEKLKTDPVCPNGMTKEDVLAAYGYPVIYKTPTIDVDTWTYWKSEHMYHRIVFRENKVIAILDLK